MAAQFSAKRLVVEACATTGKKPAKEQLVGMWGKHVSARMLVAEWRKSDGWSAPRITPYRPFEISPAASCLHYALQCFEGMKAYRGDSTIRLFRPELNAERFNSSLRRLEMPEIPKEEFIDALRRFVREESDWVPDGEGYAAYLRPTAIATNSNLGVGPAEEVTFFTMLAPVGPYFPDGYKPVSVYANAETVRAWPGGAGAFKIGANYGPSIAPQAAAAKLGAKQVLYCTPSEGGRKRLTEVGSMNIVVVWKTPAGKTQLITPPLTHGDVLPGVTRRSLLDLAATYDDLETADTQDIFLDDLLKASSEGRLLEVFGAGTAAVVAPVKSILHHADGLLAEILVPPHGDSGLGPVATRLLADLTDVHYGRSPLSDTWCVTV